MEVPSRTGLALVRVEVVVVAVVEAGLEEVEVLLTGVAGPVAPLTQLVGRQAGGQVARLCTLLLAAVEEVEADDEEEGPLQVPMPVAAGLAVEEVPHAVVVGSESVAVAGAP